MSKSRYSRISTSSAGEADMVDLKKCKKVFRMDQNGNPVQMFVNQAGQIVKTITEAENNAREFGTGSAGSSRVSRRR